MIDLLSRRLSYGYPTSSSLFGEPEAFILPGFKSKAPPLQKGARLG